MIKEKQKLRNKYKQTGLTMYKKEYNNKTKQIKQRIQQLNQQKWEKHATT